MLMLLFKSNLALWGPRGFLFALPGLLDGSGQAVLPRGTHQPAKAAQGAGRVTVTSRVILFGETETTSSLAFTFYFGQVLCGPSSPFPQFLVFPWCFPEGQWVLGYWSLTREWKVWWLSEQLRSIWTLSLWWKVEAGVICGLWTWHGMKCAWDHTLHSALGSELRAPARRAVSLCALGTAATAWRRQCHLLVSHGFSACLHFSFTVVMR